MRLGMDAPFIIPSLSVPAGCRRQFARSLPPGTPPGGAIIGGSDARVQTGRNWLRKPERCGHDAAPLEAGARLRLPLRRRLENDMEWDRVTGPVAACIVCPAGRGAV